MEYKETLQLVDAVKLLKTYEKEQNITLFNPKALNTLATLIKKLEKEQQMQNYLQQELDRRISPLEDKITQLLNHLQPQVTQMTPPLPQSTIPKENGSNEKLWTIREDTKEKQVLECANGHIINIIKDENNSRIANIDDTENHNIKNDKDLKKLKKQVEAMKPYS